MIDLLPSIEQQQIGESVRALLADSTWARSQAQEQTYARQHASSLWADLAALGCFGLSAPESSGGAGLSVVDEILVFREFGRVLISPAVLSTVLAVRIARLCAREDIVSQLIGGQRRAALMSPLRRSVVDHECSGGFHLIDAGPADFAVVWSEHGAALFDCEALQRREELASLDPTIQLSRVDLDRAVPLLWVPAETEPLWQTAMLHVGAMLTGMIEQVRDISVSYAKTREQFGHPIGVFQAIKHACADMALWAEAAWSQTVWCALRLRAGGTDVAFQSTNAAMIGAEAALACARKAIQIHGGMGFTSEITVHLYLKRAHVLCQLAGELHLLQQRLIDLRIDS